MERVCKAPAVGKDERMLKGQKWVENPKTFCMLRRSSDGPCKGSWCWGRHMCSLGNPGHQSRWCWRSPVPVKTFQWRFWVGSLIWVLSSSWLPGSRGSVDGIPPVSGDENPVPEKEPLEPATCPCATALFWRHCGSLRSWHQPQPREAEGGSRKNPGPLRSS